jgi:aryl-alcohol dehydrogenase-like predicted oxidoreductase
LREIAAQHGGTTAQLAIAWVLGRGQDIVPLVGARTRERLNEALGAMDLQLSSSDLQKIEELLPAGAIAGERYASAQMAVLDSERS